MTVKKLRRECPSQDVCSDMCSSLLKFRLPEDFIELECPPGEDVAWPCAAMLKNARSLYNCVSPSTAVETLELIKPLFSSPEQLISSRFSQYLDDPPFHCPELNVDMYQPCLVTSCAFHTDNPWELNCILFYRLRHERDVLSLNELAFLLGHHVGVLRSRLNGIFRKLSYGALKEMIARDNVSGLAVRVCTDNVCVVCEHKIEPRRRVVVKGGFIYCGKGCSSYKPPNIIKIEQEFMLPIECLLDLCVRNFLNVKNMCSALGVGPSIFIDWCKKYCVEIPAAKLPK